jgi:hypothetical protein
VSDWPPISCNDSSVTFTVDDVTGAVTSVSAVIGTRPLTLYLLNDNGTVKGTFVIDASRSINIPPGQRVTATDTVNTRGDGVQVTKRSFRHRIEW